MRVTTVAILVISSVVCCNAQKHVATSPLRVVTQIHNGIGTAKYLQRDSSYLLIKLQPGRSFNDLSENGFSLIRSLNKDFGIVKVASRTLPDLRQIAETTQPVNHLWKLSENLLEDDLKKDQRTYVIQTSNPDRLNGLLQRFGLHVQTFQNFLIVRGNIVAAMPEVLLDDAVTYVGLESLIPQEEGRVLDLYHGPNKVNKIHHEFPELNGEGIVISIKERQFNPGDIDLLGRSVSSALAHSDTSNHATEMATIISGAGNSFITGRGVTSHSQITSSSFLNLFPDSQADFSTVNSNLQNHAYGTVVENFYGALANAYDESASQNPAILHVFSSGNSGTSVAASGSYVNTPGYSNLTGNSKMAKNILVVGSVDTTGNVVSFSSRGPANDGRIKPELVAYSTAGTSNSAALVTGVAAVLQQTHRTRTGNYPDAALVKAVLINSADDVGPPGIDFITGFGNMNAYRSVTNLLENRFFEGTIGQGEVKSFDISLPAGARNLKVTLVWSDPPAPVNSAATLVNNLDLELTATGEFIRPWILDASPNVTALTASATRGIDNINNIEQVTSASPTSQLYQVNVRGVSLAPPAQKFFIAYQWDEKDTFIWNYPTANDNFPYNGETGTYFYWHSMLEEETGDLEVTIDNGISWTRIATSLDLKRGSFRWESPISVNASARARMVVGAARFETEDFTISRTLVPSVGFNCADSVLLQWNAMEEVMNYNVRKLDGKYTSGFTTEQDTAVVINKSNGAVYYAIQPVLASGKTLLRSPAVNIETFGVGCFVSSFVDESISQEGVLLRLSLGTTYGISAISFEHQSINGFIPIHTIPLPTSRVVRYLHSDPVQGLNRYRARIHFANGAEIFSDTIQNYFLTETPFIVFPNPVNAGSDLNIFSGKFETVDFQFNLYKSDGTWIRSAALVSDREFVNMDGLSPGLYLYRIEGAAGRYSGRIVVK